MIICPDSAYVHVEDPETESEDKDVCGNKFQCTYDTDLDSTHCNTRSEVSEVQVNIRMVVVEPGANASVQPPCLQGLMDLDQQSL